MIRPRVIILLAPSKAMDFTTPLPYEILPETPIFLDEAAEIAERVAKLSQLELQKLMSVSLMISASVRKYYSSWNKDGAGRPALWTYTGDVYKGVKAYELSKADADWAQRHLLISSGLYGLVRPYDGIQAYRLEMKSSIQVGRAKNLTEFWGTKLASLIDGQGGNWLCNLSSEEYSKNVTRHTSMPVITPVFFDKKPTGVIGQVPIYSKMMRGVMSRWMIDNKISSPDQLKTFTGQEYIYDAELSKPGFPAFRRDKMIPLRFA
jgi:hypothetical protein